MVAALRGLRLSMDLERRTAGLAPVPEPSAVLTMEEMYGVFLPAEGPASGAAAVVAVDDIGDRMYTLVELVENLRMEGNTMLQRILIFVQPEWKSFIRLAAPIVFALSLGCSFVPTFAQQPGQRTFASAEEAGSALFAAMRAQDEQSPLSILGPAGKDVVSSGDATEDLDARVGFVVKYQEMHRFVTEPNGTITLVVGAENWPFPIPLVNNHGSWYFDTAAGKDEILFRRIGQNEIAAMDACRELVDAQKQYFAHPPGDLPKQFAQKLVSDEGRHNGLYWHGASDEFASPINPLIAYARQNLPKDQVGEHVPFNGYFFRILTSQGPHAPGGAKNYVVDGKMSAGFAFVAYPAEYRSSGVMTFIVDESGTIYEKDLGPNTTKLAEAMTAYDPDSAWHQAE
jgi:hypothetical protein